MHFAIRNIQLPICSSPPQIRYISQPSPPPPTLPSTPNPQPPLPSYPYHPYTLTTYQLPRQPPSQHPPTNTLHHYITTLQPDQTESTPQQTHPHQHHHQHTPLSYPLSTSTPPPSHTHILLSLSLSCYLTLKFLSLHESCTARTLLLIPHANKTRETIRNKTKQNHTGKIKFRRKAEQHC